MAAAASNLVANQDQRLIVILMGRPGSGKGTQGKLISQEFKIPHISIGDLYRAELRDKTLLGTMLENHHKQHKEAFAANEIAYGILTKRLSQADCKNGFILDGIPRIAEQVEVLLSTFVSPRDVCVPLYLNVSNATICDRIAKRCMCPQCGFQVGAHEKTEFCPKTTCDRVKLTHRVEDVDDSKLKQRLDLFDKEIDGVLKAFKERKIFKIETDSTESISCIFSQIKIILIQQLNASMPIKESKKGFVSTKELVGILGPVAAIGFMMGYFFKQNARTTS